MNKHQISSIGFIVGSGLLCAFSNQIGAYICLAVGLILFGFLVWLDRTKKDRLEEFETKLNQLKERVDLQSLRNR